MQPRNTRETPVTKPDNSQTKQPGTGLPGWAVSILRGAVISLGLGVIFAWLGVYNTTEIPLFERVVYWSGLMALGIASSAVANPLIFDRWMKDNPEGRKRSRHRSTGSTTRTAGR